MPSCFAQFLTMLVCCLVSLLVCINIHPVKAWSARTLAAMLPTLAVYLCPLDILSVQKQFLRPLSFHCELRRERTILRKNCSRCATWTLCTALFLRSFSGILARCLSFHAIVHGEVRPETFCTCRPPPPLGSCILLPHLWNYKWWMYQ